MVYHTADHTRFGHSLGVYEIARRMVMEVPDIRDALDERQKIIVMLAGLLHDLGHGPFSHAFEAVTHSCHEDWTCRIIEEDPQLKGILEDCDKGLSHDVADVIRHQSSNALLPQLVSAQLDADRMDYLLRDAYFTGTAYGEFDLERVLRVLRVAQGRIVIKESGIYAIENYIMARYHMYWQVYYHPTARSYENMMHCLFSRLHLLALEQKLPPTIPQFHTLATGEALGLEDYFVLDESACLYAFSLLEHASDPVVRDLSARLRDRRLFAFAEATEENVQLVQKRLSQRGLDVKYYMCRDDVRQSPYVPYAGDVGGAIWVRMHGGEIKELEAASNIVWSLVHGPQRSDDRVYFPKGILE